MAKKLTPLRMAPFIDLFGLRFGQAHSIRVAFEAFEEEHDHHMWMYLLQWAIEKEQADWLEQKILAGSSKGLRIAKQQMNGNFLEM